MQCNELLGLYEMMVADYLDLPSLGAFVLKGGMVGDASGHVEA